jgi:hypothetical protein
MYYLNNIWYSQYPKKGFHTFNDLGEWNQVDKVGHAYSAYVGTKLFTTFYRWSGVSASKSRKYGVIGGLAYLSVIETLDGFSHKWGFSLGDMGANIAGSLGYALQDRYWGEQRIIMKYSTHRQDYKTVELLKRANNLYGTSTLERIFKDYNAQTYWLSTSPRSFMPQSYWPQWLNLAVGYGADGMYGGFENIARDDYGNIILATNGLPEFDRRDIQRIRQWYIAPDIDFSKIPWGSKTLKDFFKIVNLKMPLPALQYNSSNQWKLHAAYF